MAFKALTRIFLVFIGAGLLNVAMAANISVGVVNIAKILDEAPQADAARSALEREFGPREREMIETQKKIQELEDKLNRDSAIMSDGERAKLERDVMARKRDAKRDQDEFRDDLNFQRNEALERLQRQMVDSIRSFAKEKKYDLILAEGVVYMSDAVDITPQILEHLKQEFAKNSGSK